MSTYDESTVQETYKFKSDGDIVSLSWFNPVTLVRGLVTIKLREG